MTETLDPRLHAYRPDLADARLKGKVAAARFVAGQPHRVTAPSAPVKRTPGADAALDSEALRGEIFTVFDTAAEGWSWGQLATDGYVGFIPTDALGSPVPEPTHRIAALHTFVYPGPDMKLPVTAALSLGAAVAIDREAETRGTRYVRLAGGEGWIGAAHATPVAAAPAADFVAVAKRFVEAPYLWGGRTSLGLDCSALVQLSLMTAGKPAPRDTDLQEKMVGKPVENGFVSTRRGDLIFWKGHVAIVLDSETVVHASGHHLTVVVEPLATALARIGPPTSVKRL
ncbi:MAG TPA: NlpC/P60 family protein [Bauldia sp.]